jgi:hypothetical protein
VEELLEFVVFLFQRNVAAAAASDPNALLVIGAFLYAGRMKARSTPQNPAESPAAIKRGTYINK